MSLSILIAEKNQFTATEYDKILRRHGHKTTIAKDGLECLEKYQSELKKSKSESDKTPFDAVVLDQSMSEKACFHVAERILEVKPTQRIIFSSTYAMTKNQDTKHLENKIGFLPKPFSLDAFVQKIESN